MTAPSSIKLSKWCIYDNPNTMCREWWMDGKLDSFISMKLICLSTKPWMPKFDKWISGNIVGDKEALIKPST